ncbi:MAG: hypothetical protein NT039_00995 [Candidatus Berkelbacteria bacterium]|nr:hypothetical protein [Candidatus Berkelbacteria bacterium]
MKKEKIINFIIIFILVAFFLLFITDIIIQRELGLRIYDLIYRSTQKELIFETTDFGHQLGKVVEDSSYDGTVMQVDPSDFQSNGQNYVNCGPGIFLFPGKYRLTYDIDIANIEENEDFAVLDIFRLGSGVEEEKKLNPLDYYGEYKKETLEFETNGGRSYEFRILYLGKGDVKVGNAKLESLGRNYSLLFRRSLEVFKNFMHSW